MHFSDFIFHKCSDPFSFCDNEVPVELLLQSSAHFVTIIFQKCAEPAGRFAPYHPDREECDLPEASFWPKPSTCRNRDPTVATPGAKLTEIAQGFVPETVSTRVNSCVNSHAPDFLLLLLLLPLWLA